MPDLCKKLFEVVVKSDFVPSSSYVAEIAGYPYGGIIPGKDFKYKLGWFDLDGTLNKISSPDAASLTIRKLEECGIEREKILRPIKRLLQYKDFESSEKEFTKVLRDANFNRYKYIEICEEVANEFVPIGNCKECISSMKKIGYSPVLASYSPHEVVKRIGKNLGFDASFGSSFEFDEDGKFVSFRWLRKEKIRDEKFKENLIHHGCYFVLDDDPNFAPVLKTGINPYFLVEEPKTETEFDSFICVPEVRRRNDMLLLVIMVKKWEDTYVELFNSYNLEFEKVKVANEAKKSYQEFLLSGEKIFVERFSRNVSTYLFMEIRPDRKPKLGELLANFQLKPDVDKAKEINDLLLGYLGYNLSEKIFEILKTHK
jgi:phosphoserine phosphatase